MSKRIAEIEEYKYSYSQNPLEYKITHSNKPKPNTFFKYYALKETSVDALTHLYLYASHPEDFNDPFDCYKYLLEFDDIASCRALWEHKFDELLNIGGEEFAKKYSSQAFHLLFFKKLGMFSLCSSMNKPNMWANYASNEGFCVEFDTAKFPFQTFGPFPILYVDKLEPIKTSEYGVHQAALKFANVKLKEDWEKEDEWRLYIPNLDGFDMKAKGEGAEQFNYVDDHDRKFRYKLDSVKSINLGIEFFKESLVKYVDECEIEMNTIGDYLRTKVLDYLSTLCTTKYIIAPKIRWMLRNRPNIEFKEIIVMKIAENCYRITENMVKENII